MTNKEKLEKLKKLADAMYYAAKCLTTDASRLHKAMEEYHQFIINEYYKEEQTIPDIVDEHFDEMLGEEPVNNDFEMALAEMIDKSRTSVIESLVIAAQWKDELIKLAKSEEPVSEDLEKAAKECAFNLQLQEYFKKGARWQKEQMMAKAVDGHATFEFYGLNSKTYGTIAHDPICLDDLGLKDTDKVKLIIIKEG